MWKKILLGLGMMVIGASLVFAPLLMCTGPTADIVEEIKPPVFNKILPCPGGRCPIKIPSKIEEEKNERAELPKIKRKLNRKEKVILRHKIIRHKRQGKPVPQEWYDALMTFEPWVEHNPKLMQELLKGGQKAFVHYTADWCLYCKVQWATVDEEELVEEARKLGVVLVKADYTKYDESMREDLERLKSGGIPTYLFIDSFGKEHVLHSVWGETKIIDKMKELR